MKQTGLQVLLGALVGVACGCASALFLTMLEWVTATRVVDERWVWALPLGGFGIGLVYERFGARVRAGNNLIIDTIHDGGPEVPLRMAPLVLLGTVTAHLFGASVGREGTAVQMGASLADFLAHRLKVPAALRTQLLSAGVAGGFGSVFGTPIAGAIFGLEFVRKGHVKYAALLPALVAAVVGDLTTRALGVGHTHYKSPPATPLTWELALKWLPFALAIALTTIAFVELTHLVKRHAGKWVPRLPVRMALGGVVLIALWRGFGGDFLGLGVPTIVRAFEDPALPVSLFAVKLVFTAVSIGAVLGWMLLALALHLDPVYVGAHHLSRIFFVSVTLPLVAHRMTRKPKPPADKPRPPEAPFQD